MSTKTSNHKKSFWSKVLAVTLSGLLAIQMCPASALAVPDNAGGETPVAAGGGSPVGAQDGDAATPTAGAGAAGTAGTDVSATQGSAADALAKADPAPDATQDKKDQAASDKAGADKSDADKDKKDQAKKNVALKENLQFRTPRADGQVTDDSIVSGVIAANGRGYRLLSSSGPTQIRDFKAEIFYGGKENQPLGSSVFHNGTYSAPEESAGYVWNAQNSAADHRFNYRLSFKLGNENDNGDGVYTGSADDGAAEGSTPAAVRIKIPTSIFKDMNGNRGDYYEMSVPSREDVLEAIDAGEQLDRDMSFAYYEEEDANHNKTGYIILYNFRDVFPGFEGFIELSYITKYATFQYRDMTESDSFTATMTAKLFDVEKPTANPLATDEKTKTVKPAYINTHVELSYAESRIPVRYDVWPTNWGPAPGANAVPGVTSFNPNDYVYLIWEVRSRVGENTEPYFYNAQDSIAELEASKGNQALEIPNNSAFPIAVKFSGQNGYQIMNHPQDSEGVYDLAKGSVDQPNPADLTTAQTVSDLRYDYVMMAMKKDFWEVQADHWKITNDTTITVTPRDGLDEPSSATYRRIFSWNKPSFDGNGGGGFSSWKWADGMYRYQAGRDAWPREQLTNLGMSAGHYSSYNLQDMIDGAVGRIGGLDYAVGMNGYIQPWTYFYQPPASQEGQGGADDAGTTTQPPAGYDPTKDLNNYYVMPVKYEVVDNQFAIYDENEQKTVEKMGAGDYRLDTLAFSISAQERAYNPTTAAFDIQATPVYLQDKANTSVFANKVPGWTANPKESLDFYGELINGDDKTWVKVASYDVKAGTLSTDANYVDQQKSTANKLVFKEGVNFTGYKAETYNTHYYTFIGTVPTVSLIDKKGATAEENGAFEKILTRTTTTDPTDGHTINPTESVAITNKAYTTLYDYKSAAEASTAEDKTGLSTDPYTHAVKHSDPADTDFVRKVLKQSLLKKNVTATSNIVKRKQYSVTWHAELSETFIAGQDQQEFVEQKGGIFYDLLPLGASLDPESVMVKTQEGEIRPSGYNVEQIQNWKDSGRVLVAITVKEPALKYDLYYQSIHPYEALRDYGNVVDNMIAFKTNNAEIKGGFANSETYSSGNVVNAKPISGTTSQEGTGTEYLSTADSALLTNLPMVASDDQSKSFLYNHNLYDVSVISAAATGITKKVLTNMTKTYSSEGMTTNDADYSYRLRFQNSFANEMTDTIVYDLLENWTNDEGRTSDWHGVLKSIDFSQLLDKLDLSATDGKKVAPVAYVSTMDNIDLTQQHSLDSKVGDQPVWQEFEAFKGNLTGEALDQKLATVKAVAVDLSKDTDGQPFVFKKGAAFSLYVYMHAPADGAERKNADGSVDPNGYPEAYNNVYMWRGLRTETEHVDPSLIDRPYTTVGMMITGNVGVHKISPEDQPIKDITFRLRGTSDYGTPVDMLQTTDGTGYLTFKGVEKGAYKLSEYEGTADWLMDATERTVEITSAGRTLIDNVDCTDKEIDIVNQPRVHGDVTFQKCRAAVPGDDTHPVLPGATFELSGTSAYGNEIHQVATSNGLGVVYLRNIEIGEYKLKEISTTDDYVLSDEVYKVVVSGDSNSNVDFLIKHADGTDVEKNVFFQEVYNTPKYWDVNIRKTDATNPSLWLQGATVRLSGEKLSDYSYTPAGATDPVTASRDEKGNYYLECTSDITGKISFPHLEAGSYVLREIEAPSNVDGEGHTGTGGNLNYVLDETERIVTVKPDGTVTVQGLSNATGEYVLPNERAMDGEITVYKRWEDPSATGRPNDIQVTMTGSEEATRINGVKVTKEWVGDTASMRPSDNKLNVKLYKGVRTIDDYTIVDYVESREGSYIDTGVNADSNLKIDGNFSVASYNKFALFGARRGSEAKDKESASFMLLHNDRADTGLNPYHGATGYPIGWTGYSSAYPWSAAPKPQAGTDVSNIFNAKMDGTSVEITGAGVDYSYTFSGVDAAEFDVGYNLYLFGLNEHYNGWNGNRAGMRIYGFKMWKGDELVRDFMPVYDSVGGRFGLYDMVYGKFYPSSGSALTGVVPQETLELVAESTAAWSPSGNMWTYTFNVDKGGHPIVLDGSETYYVCEDPVPSGYVSSADGLAHKVTVVGGKATITNTLPTTVGEFDYTGDVQEYTVPVNGWYKLEAWGAQGGDFPNEDIIALNKGVSADTNIYYGGKGAYTQGTVFLNAGEKLYVYVGGNGNNDGWYDGKASNKLVEGHGHYGGFNGGGRVTTNGDDSASGNVNDDQARYGAPGGGATDFRTVPANDLGSAYANNNDLSMANMDSYKSRIMVAAGGGGANNRSVVGPADYGAGNGGYGGALVGGNGGVKPGTVEGQQYASYARRYGLGGTQTAAGGERNTYERKDIAPSYSFDARFLYGGQRQTGGGGGWYGGGGGDHAGGGGGSSYINGYEGCDETYKDENHLIMNGAMIAGNESMPQPTGEDAIGRSGNGYARISLVMDSDASDAAGVTPSNQTPTNNGGTVIPAAEYKTAPGAWEKLSDGKTWKYTFKVFNDNATYTLTETPVPGYTPDATSIVLNGMQQKSVVFVNRKNNAYGDLKVVKNVVDKQGNPITGSTQKFDFTVTLTGDGILTGDAEHPAEQIIDGVVFTNGVAHFSLSNGQERVIHDIPADVTYKVEEQAVDSFTTVYDDPNDDPDNPKDNPNEGTIVANETVDEQGNPLAQPISHMQAVQVTNTYHQPAETPTTVKVEKKVTGSFDPSDVNKTFAFRAEFGSLQPSLQYSATVAGQTVKFQSNAEGAASLDFSLKADQDATFVNIPVGATYRVMEMGGDYYSSFKLVDTANNKTGHFISQSGGELTQNQKGESLSTATETIEACSATNSDGTYVQSPEAPVVTFTNNLEGVQTLKLKKVVSNPAGFPANQKFQFNIKFTDLAENASITSDVGKLVVREGEADANFNLENGGSVTFEGVPIGAKYVITESKNDCKASYVIDSSIDGVTDIKGGNDRSNKDLKTDAQTIRRGDDPEVTFTNEHELGTLVLGKTVKGNMGNKDASFDFNVTIPSMKGRSFTVGPVTYTFDSETGLLTNDDPSCNASVKLKHGESFAIQDIIPVGSAYTITEAQSDYTPVYEVSEYAVVKTTGDDGTVTKTPVNPKVVNTVKGNTLKETLLGEYAVAACTNTLTSEIPTGVNLGLLVPLALIAGAVISLGVLAWRRQEDE